LESCITAKATRKGGDQLQKLKTANNLDGLFFRVLRSRAISMLDNRVHKQATITGQKYPVLVSHQIEQLPVITLLVVGDIKTEETKITGERP
jgi:hypothetical protein